MISTENNEVEITSW